MSLEQRVSDLERAVRNQRRVGLTGGALIILVMIVAGGRPDGAASELVGRSLTLRTEDGQTWLEAIPEAGGGRLTLTAPKHDAIVEISTSDEQQQLIMERGNLVDKTYNRQVILKAGEGKAQLALLRAPMSVIAYLGYHPDNHGVAFVTDKSGKTTWIAPAGARKFEETEKQGSEDKKK